MAKPKKKFIVAKLTVPNIIQVWTNDLPSISAEIRTIEGVILVMDLVGCIHVHIDPRYDIDELVQEITELLTSEVPDIFYE